MTVVDHNLQCRPEETMMMVQAKLKVSTARMMQVGLNEGGMTVMP